MSADTTTTEMKPVPEEGSTTPQPELIPVTDIYAEPERRVPPSSADAPPEPTDRAALARKIVTARAHLKAINDHGYASPDAIASVEEAITELDFALDAAKPPLEPRRFPEADLMVNLGPTVAARVVIGSRDGKGWTLNELARLIAFLELQRSFLEDAPLKVSVTFGTPK